MNERPHKALFHNTIIPPTTIITPSESVIAHSLPASILEREQQVLPFPNPYIYYIYSSGRQTHYFEGWVGYRVAFVSERLTLSFH
uniref:Uncharacterized protein n=2 Tax=Picea TaxID=3328 RepID=A0A101LZG6_PICGL|nr:hypothetical protein ABT39_MTgene5171 [Picea glauca]QHR91647.1 hypothetical protein Q903MT_gene5682 [Picea sitchensis]